MKIIKYRKSSKGKYKIDLADGNTLVLYEEVILKFNLLLKGEIDEDLLIEIDKCNQEWDVYYVALHSLKARMKSIYDMKSFLIRKEYPLDLVEKVIDKLVKQGYLNDRGFAKSYVRSQMLTTSKGPYKIERDLGEKKIDIEIIKEALLDFTEDEQILRIEKLINKGIKTNHNKGGLVLKQKIYNDIKNLGYDVFLINKVIADYSFDIDNEIAKKEYEKLYNKYKNKYNEQELKRVIREKLYKKGLKYEEE